MQATCPIRENRYNEIVREAPNSQEAATGGAWSLALKRLPSPTGWENERPMNRI